jgi:hypothetical protein|tara:strand:- start:468 stop:680 length:213 start_codon:yes stop_codon:yes gene_type:complete
MKPTQKKPHIDAALNTISGDNRVEAVEANRCIKPPIGCGLAGGDFKDAISLREYTISGLCQGCQDRIYGE